MPPRAQPGRADRPERHGYPSVGEVRPDLCLRTQAVVLGGLRREDRLFGETQRHRPCMLRVVDNGDQVWGKAIALPPSNAVIVPDTEVAAGSRSNEGLLGSRITS